MNWTALEWGREYNRGRCLERHKRDRGAWMKEDFNVDGCGGTRRTWRHEWR